MELWALKLRSAEALMTAFRYIKLLHVFGLV